ncbi:MAG: putative Ig domain-containing protein [Bacteroidales bacterium]|nr:putative Ig domain-containing protein [Bacteroidales bacterium]
MKKRILSSFLLFLCLFAAQAQEVTVSEARFCKGDDPAYQQAGFDDSAWPILSLEKDWVQQGIQNPDGFAWYRIHVIIPSSLKKSVSGPVLLDLGPIDDADETWMNGRFVGRTGSNPEDPEGYSSQWTTPRRYLVDPKMVRWDKENIIAVRVYNGGDPGGFFERPVRIGKPVLSDYVSMSLTGGQQACRLVLSSTVKTSGIVEMKVSDPLTGEEGAAHIRPVRLSPKQEAVLSWPLEEQRLVTVTYRDDKHDGLLTASYASPYILTPPAPVAPRYNGPLVFGVRPGSPIIFRLAFSGERPMKYAVEGLPEGVTLDSSQGVLSGQVEAKGDYPLVLVATNAHGEARQTFTLKVGDKIALTPPMGWNSWNCWGLSVSQEKVMASAAALINRGLADYGYSYINVDDAWEAEERAADGRIVCNEKFPDMKGLGDWLHSNGLRLGIYSSPGDRTCGGYLGTLDHEQQDAETWNEWGVDYLKYDWCGYSKVFNAQADRSTASYVRPYLKMQEYLRQQPRDIFYSLCQYGMADVWTWGHAVDANSWRTTGDITDTWQSLYNIGFQRQTELYPYAGPGHWNDPDMLVVGKVGWSDHLRDSRLTPDEQYTHITLWSLLAANMLIGCDIAQMDDFTFNLLCNNEVNAVNQDILGIQAHRDSDRDGIQIWSRPLADGSFAVGIFNLNEKAVPVNIAEALAQIHLGVPATVRDLWRQQDIPADTYAIPSHGVRFIKVRLPQ